MANQSGNYDQFSNLQENNNMANIDNGQVRLNNFHTTGYPSHDITNLSVNSKAGLKLRGMKQMN